MKLTADDYKRHYRALSDDEFLAIDRDDLVDVARRCYDGELARRHLAPEPDEPDPAVEETKPERRTRTAAPEGELVQVGLVTSSDWAINVQKMLDDADIPSDVTHEPILPGRYAAGCIGVLVPVACADEARDLLGSALTEIHRDFVRHWFEQEWRPEGRDLSDCRVAIDDLICEDYRVAARLTVEGVDQRTGSDVKLEGLAMVRVADGRIAETWIKLDQ